MACRRHSVMAASPPPQRERPSEPTPGRPSYLPAEGCSSVFMAAGSRPAPGTQGSLCGVGCPRGHRSGRRRLGGLAAGCREARACGLRAGCTGFEPAGPEPARGHRLAGALCVFVSEESQALYRAQEVFVGLRPPNRAVGLTRAIRGEVLIDRRHFPNSRPGPIAVDIRQLTSDDPWRDQAIRDRWLESNRFPIATFRVATVEGLPEAYREGDRVAVVLHGDLTVRDVTRRVSFQGSFVLEGAVLRGTASAILRMTDFGFEPPSILGLLRVEDEVEVQVDLVARRTE